MSSPILIIRTEIISSIDEVHLYDTTLAHIHEGHPEVQVYLPSILNAIEQAIVSPTFVELSYGNSLVFVDESSTNHSGDPLRVPVKIVQGTSGRVKTAFFATTQQGGNILWSRS
ncbi:hypothetical protein SAMN02745157_0722 [Kaistia soli DSM 19436]|uniref:Uncharacterized protein n=1 Tax=Kaistia soli DSM 19436 TaxID=1122133 RepID=A0A1M4VJK1_9HYPH|nr:hypothetical protein SAMN02745157_0722 [Kaistia soli DSM 19436]